MITLQNILSQEIVQRLGWTLLHFIWQAATVALILAILLRLLRKSTANLRYIFACLALAMIILLPVITIKLVPVSQPLTAAKFEPAAAPTMPPTVETPAPETIVKAEPSLPKSADVVPAIPFKQRAVDTLEPTLPYVVTGWLIGVFSLSIWNLGGWTQLQRLKRRMVKQLDSTLQNKLKMLAQKLKVKQTVKFMESALVQIPTVVGWLRPVILLPASALTGLSSEQLEAIVAHELAHIKRFDYLVNILQTIVETLGFYHPAVWWVSYKIRAERENCCDDIAVSISGDRVSYAGALASMEEIRTGRSKLAVAADGCNLFRRICRLLGKDSTKNTGLSWVPAGTAILLIIALAIPTTLALTNKSKSNLTEQQAKLQFEDDIIEPALDIESPVANIPPAPVPSKSPAPSDEENALVVKANCFVVEVPIDSKLDGETLKEAEKLLGNNISLSNRKVDVILRQTVKATAAAKDKSAENKRITEKQFNALLKMLDSKGHLKILMNPMIETLSGKTATIISSQKVPLHQVIKASPGDDSQPTKVPTEIEYVEVADSIEITPHVFADSHIILDVEAEFGSLDIPAFKAQTMPSSLRQLSTQVSANAGESLIIGGLVDNSPALGDNIKNTIQQTNEILFIITPTIITPPVNLKEITDKQIEGFKRELSTQNLKKLGLAIAMYADDNDRLLPETLEPLKPYIGNEQDYLWLLDNIKYVLKETKYQPNRPHIPVAYDKTLKQQQSGTNVLFLDGHVEFVTNQRLNELDLERAKFLIETWILEVNKDFIQNIDQNADSLEEAKELIKLKPMLLEAVDGPNKTSFIPPEHNIDLLLKALRSHKASKIIAHPHIICQEGKSAKITTAQKIPILKGYTEPNSPSENPKPKFDQVEEGITISLRPNLTPNNNIYLQFDLEIAQISGFEEKMYKGKYPYKLPTLHRTDQSTCYTAKNGQTILFGGHKIADRQDNQAEPKDLLVLVKAQIIVSSEQDKPVQAKPPAVVEPPGITTKVITPPTIAKSRTERQKDDEQEKTKPVTEQKPRMVQKFFKLKYQDASQIARILRPLLTNAGYISTDERTNGLIVIDTVENLVRIEKAITQYDITKAGETVTEIFEIRYSDPVEIAELLKKLINGRPDNGAIIEQGKEPIVLIPEPKRKWIIVKASAENLKQIGQWIEKLDTRKTIGLDPIDKAVHEQLEMIVDLSDLAPGMSFSEVIEKLENSVEPPLQIQPIWKDLLENAEVEQATPAGMDPLPHIKLRKALEILLTSVTSTQLGEFGELTYIVDQGVILIGTEKMFPPKMGPHVYDTSDLLGTDATKPSPENMLKIAEQIKEGDVPLDVDKVKPRIIELQNSDAEQMVELLKTLFTKEGGGGLNIQDILIDRGTKVNQKIVGPPYKQLTFEVVPGTKKLIIISKIPEAYDVIEEFIFDLDRQNVSPENIKQIVQSRDMLDTEKTIGIDPIDAAVYEQLETIVDLSDLAPEMSFSEVIGKLENSVEPSLQIQPIWKDLLENAEIEQATPAGMDPLNRVKLRKALEILLTSVSSTGMPKPTYVVEDGVILIGTAEILPTNQPPSSQVKAKITKLLEETEKPMTPLEQVQKQLDELVKQQQEALKVTEPNLPPAPKVPLVSFNFVDETLLNALQSIAAAANVTIIPDETVKGIVSCTLKEVTVETAIDIVLAGTPYVWKKTPYYYLVASGGVAALEAEPSEITERMESAKKLANLGKALLIYANDHDDKYPNSLFNLRTYLKQQDFSWIMENVEYQASGKMITVRPDVVIAYDKKLLEQGKGTNVLYNDIHVDFVKAQELKRLGISESEILIETQFWSVTEDFLKDVGLDANFENLSDDWRGHLAATYPAGPNGQPYGLMIDELHLKFLLRAIQAHDDSKAIIAPRVLTREGTTAKMRFLTEEYNYISGYDEPQDPTGEPQPKRDKVEIGTRIWITPKLTDNNRNVNLDFKLEMTQLEGIIEGKYKEKYPIYKPIMDVISMDLPCTIPDGKSMLIGGLKINEHITKKPGTPGLGDLPLIGAVFSGQDKTTEPKMLLILVKPITNPQQKATKVLPGQEDSEEQIRRLAEQLDKKLKSPTK